VTGITLGIVKQKGFNRQNGRNQAFNHAGNLVGAAVSGLLGWKFGYFYVFLLAALFGVVAVCCVLMIPPVFDRQSRSARPQGG
jgi:predicted MFS family arabinose efflux permease